MHNFEMCPRQSNACIFPDKYNDRNPRPAKDPAISSLLCQMVEFVQVCTASYYKLNMQIHRLHLTVKSKVLETEIF